MEACKKSGDFQQLVREDPEVSGAMTAEEIDEVFRLERYLDHVDTIFDRVFGADAAGSRPGGE